MRDSQTPQQTYAVSGQHGLRLRGGTHTVDTEEVSTCRLGFVPVAEVLVSTLKPGGRQEGHTISFLIDKRSLALISGISRIIPDG